MKVIDMSSGGIRIIIKDTNKDEFYLSFVANGTMSGRLLDASVTGEWKMDSIFQTSKYCICAKLDGGDNIFCNSAESFAESFADFPEYVSYFSDDVMCHQFISDNREIYEIFYQKT